MANQNSFIPHISDRMQWPIDGTYIYTAEDPIENGRELGRAAEGDGRFLFTDAIVTSLAIAVSGTYPTTGTDSASPTRYNRFLLQVGEKHFETEYPKFQEEVEAAKAQGLQDLHVHVVTCQPFSFRNYTKITVWSQEREARKYHAFEKDLMRQLRALIGTDSDSDNHPSIHWFPYEYDEERNVSIALFSNREVIVEQEVVFWVKENRYSRWLLQERQWINTENPAPLAIPQVTGAGSSSVK
ncbi:hypothetical protein PG989_011984 [Apiospora arundinis]